MVLIVLEEESEYEVAINELFLFLEFNWSFNVLLQFLPIVEITHHFLYQQQGIQIVHIAHLEKSPRPNQTIPFH